MARKKRAAKDGGSTSEGDLRAAFQRSVDEGVSRLDRDWLELIATGLVGGMDVGLGILAMLVVEHATGSHILGALAFATGFLALTLGKSELFTENFLVPVAAVLARKATVVSLFRLWLVTALMNLAGGWLFTWLFVLGLPQLTETALETAAVYTAWDFSRSMALGVLGGIAITLMTWMERGAKSEFGKILAVSAIAFLLAAAPLNHVVVASLEMFVALHTGAASYGYGEWARVAAWGALANMAGGLLFVTTLRFAQVGEEKIREEQAGGGGAD